MEQSREKSRRSEAPGSSHRCPTQAQRFSTQAVAQAVLKKGLALEVPPLRSKRLARNALGSRVFDATWMRITRQD
eukprot:338787-Pleurochrysis_carterae.AAC.1